MKQQHQIAWWRSMTGRLLAIAVLIVFAYSFTIVKNGSIIRATAIGSDRYTSIMNYRFVMEDAAKLSGNLEDLHRGFADLVAKGITDDIEDRIASLDDFRIGVIGVIAQLKDSSLKKDDELIAIISAIDKTWETYNQAGDDKTIGLLLDGEIDKAKAFEANEHSAMFSAVMESSSQLREALTKKVDAIENEAIKTIAKNRRNDIILSIVILAGIIIMLLLTSMSIVRPINSAVVIFKDIAHGEGDLTKRLSIKSNDEVGILAGYFNQFAEKIRTMIGTISATVQTLNNSSDVFLSTSSGLREASETLRIKTSAVAISSSGAATTLQSISGSANEMSGSVQTVASAVEEISASFSEITRSCREELDIACKASEKARLTGEIVGRLGNSSAEIGSVIKVIENIADKTNLLSLNAAIEAASAGDAGRGFAVVANEVKELAKQTSSETQHIREKIEEMQGTTQSAITAIGDIGLIIDKVRTLSETIVRVIDEQNTATGEIARAIATTSSSATHISGMIVTSSENIQDVSEGVSQVADTYSSTSAGVEKIEASARELVAIARHISEELAQFRI